MKVIMIAPVCVCVCGVCMCTHANVLKMAPKTIPKQFLKVQQE